MQKLTDIFKKKLEQRQFEFNEAYWKELEKKLDASAGKTGKGLSGGLAASMAGIALLAGLTIWFFYPSGNNMIKENTSANKNIINSIITGKNITSENGIIKNIQKETAGEKNELQKTAEAKAPSISTLNSGTTSPGKSPEQNIATLKQVEKKKTIEKPAAGLSHENSNISFEDKDIENALSNANNFEERTTSNTNNTEVEIISPDDLFISSSPSVSSSSFSQKNIFAGTNQENDNYYLAGGIPSIPKSNDLHLLLMKGIYAIQLPVSKEAPKHLPELKNNPIKKYSFFIEGYTGFMHTDKILKTTDTTLRNYLSRRKREETPIVSYNLGMDFGLEKNRWNFSIGLNYHQQGEITNYKPEFYQWIRNTTSTWNIEDNSYWKKDTVNVNSYLVSEGSWQPIDSSLTFWNTDSQSYVTQTVTLNQYVVNTIDTQYVYSVDSNYFSDFDSVEIKRTDSAIALVNDPNVKSEKRSTKISYIEFPVLAGYEFHTGRISFMIRTGISMSILTKLNGVYLKNDITGTEQISFTRVNKTMLNYLLHAGANYYITEKLLLHIDPMFRINLYSALKDKGFQQRYWNAGLNLGLMYKF